VHRCNTANSIVRVSVLSATELSDISQSTNHGPNSHLARVGTTIKRLLAYQVLDCLSMCWHPTPHHMGSITSLSRSRIWAVAFHQVTMPVHLAKGATRYSTLDKELTRCVGCQVRDITAKKHSRLQGQRRYDKGRLLRSSTKRYRQYFSKVISLQDGWLTNTVVDRSPLSSSALKRNICQRMSIWLSSLAWVTISGWQLLPGPKNLIRGGYHPFIGF